MRIQYLSLTVKRARKHEKSMAGDYGPTIEDALLHAKLREVGASKEKTAGIANTGRSAAGKRGA